MSKIVFVKEQTQTKGDKTYTYYYLYHSYRQADGSPTNMYLGKADDGISSIMSNFDDEAKDHGLDISDSYRENIKSTLERIDENSNSVEEKIELLREANEDDDKPDFFVTGRSDDTVVAYWDIDYDGEDTDYGERAIDEELVNPKYVVFNGGEFAVRASFQDNGKWEFDVEIENDDFDVEVQEADYEIEGEVVLEQAMDSQVMVGYGDISSVEIMEEAEFSGEYLNQTSNEDMPMEVGNWSLKLDTPEKIIYTNGEVYIAYQVDRTVISADLEYDVRETGEKGRGSSEVIEENVSMEEFREWLESNDDYELSEAPVKEDKPSGELELVGWRIQNTAEDFVDVKYDYAEDPIPVNKESIEEELEVVDKFASVNFQSEGIVSISVEDDFFDLNEDEQEYMVMHEATHFEVRSHGSRFFNTLIDLIEDKHGSIDGYRDMLIADMITYDERPSAYLDDFQGASRTELESLNQKFATNIALISEVNGDFENVVSDSGNINLKSDMSNKSDPVWRVMLGQGRGKERILVAEIDVVSGKVEVVDEEYWKYASSVPADAEGGTADLETIPKTVDEALRKLSDSIDQLNESLELTDFDQVEGWELEMNNDDRIVWRRTSGDYRDHYAIYSKKANNLFVDKPKFGEAESFASAMFTSDQEMVLEDTTIRQAMKWLELNQGFQEVDMMPTDKIVSKQNIDERVKWADDNILEGLGSNEGSLNAVNDEENRVRIMNGAMTVAYFLEVDDDTYQWVKQNEYGSSSTNYEDTEEWMGESSVNFGKTNLSTLNDHSRVLFFDGDTEDLTAVSTDYIEQIVRVLNGGGYTNSVLDDVDVTFTGLQNPFISDGEDYRILIAPVVIKESPDSSLELLKEVKSNSSKSYLFRSDDYSSVEEAIESFRENESGTFESKKIVDEFESKFGISEGHADVFSSESGLNIYSGKDDVAMLVTTDEGVDIVDRFTFYNGRGYDELLKNPEVYNLGKYKDDGEEKMMVTVSEWQNLDEAHGNEYSGYNKSLFEDAESLFDNPTHLIPDKTSPMTFYDERTEAVVVLSPAIMDQSSVEKVESGSKYDNPVSKAIVAETYDMKSIQELSNYQKRTINEFLEEEWESASSEAEFEDSVVESINNGIEALGNQTLSSTEKKVLIDLVDEVLDFESSEEMTKDEMIRSLTQEGIMVGQQASEVITEDDIQIIKNQEATPLYVSEELIKRLRDNKAENADYVEFEVSKEVPEFQGVDLETYDIEAGETVELPEENAEILKNRGYGEVIENSSGSSVEEPDDQVIQYVRNIMSSHGEHDKEFIENQITANSDYDSSDVRMAIDWLVENEDYEISGDDMVNPDYSPSPDTDVELEESLDKAVIEAVDKIETPEGSSNVEAVIEVVSDQTAMSEEEVKRTIKDLKNKDVLYEPRGGLLAVQDYSIFTDDLERDEVMDHIDLRKWESFDKEDGVYSFTHKDSGKDIWIQRDSDGRYTIYGDVVSAMSSEGMIKSPMPKYVNKQYALDDFKRYSNMWEQDYKVILSSDEPDRDQVDEAYDRVLQELNDAQDNSISYEELNSEIDQFSEDVLEEAVNKLLSEGTAYEPEPGVIKKL